MPGHNTEVCSPTFPLVAILTALRYSFARGTLIGPICLPLGKSCPSAIYSSIRLMFFSAKDSEVILWDLAKQAKGANEFLTDGRIHGTLGKLSQEVQGDLTSLHWSSDGQLLAIGSYDSVLRVATRTNLIWMTADLHEVSVALLALRMI